MPGMLYLDNAATSCPKPAQVYDALREALERYGASPGRGSYAMAKEAQGLVEETRQLLAELFHITTPERVIFTLNATDALNMALKGVLKPGDHVVTTVMEHNSVARPLNRLEREGVIHVTRIPATADGWIDPSAVAEALKRPTKLVAIVHGSNVSGTLQPLTDIGPLVREAGALLLVDAAQTAGAVPIHVEAMQIDLLAFPGHKALLGPPGTGGLYVGRRAALSPWREGGTGIWSEEPLQPAAFPQCLEAGSPNTLGLIGLRAALQFLLHQGVDAIRAHELTLTQRLVDGLSADERITLYGPRALQQRIAVVSLSLQGCAPEQVGTWLDQRHGIAVRSGLHCAPGAHRVLGTFPQGTLRISPGYFTSHEDIDRCLQVLQEAAASLAKPQGVEHVYA